MSQIDLAQHFPKSGWVEHDAAEIWRLTDRAVRYTRRVTQLWCLFFIANALIISLLALYAPLAWWTLYTGLIAYLLMGLLFAGEWLVRQRVRREA